MSARLDVVWRLPERDVQLGELVGREFGRFAVDHLRAIERRERAQYTPGQDVPTRRALVAQDAVEKQVVADALVGTQEHVLRRATGARRACLREPDMSGKVLEADVLANASILVEHGHAKLVEAEAAAACPADVPGDAALLSIHDFQQPRLAMGAGMRPHLYANPAPVQFVRHCGGGAATE